MVIGAALVVLLAVAVVLLVAGLNKNSQADSLHEHGIRVAVTVTGCQGLLGGSGSNPAGYACRGTYTFDARHFEEDIPGTALLHTGSVIRGVIVPNDPGLLSTPGEVADERASWNVFIAPVVLLAIVLGVVAVIVWTSRRTRARHSPVGQ
jgi:heme/copper-type cytochrome/quinol oxidase subunit 2